MGNAVQTSENAVHSHSEHLLGEGEWKYSPPPNVEERGRMCLRMEIEGGEQGEKATNVISCNEE